MFFHLWKDIDVRIKKRKLYKGNEEMRLTALLQLENKKTVIQLEPLAGTTEEVTEHIDAQVPCQLPLLAVV